MRTSSGRARARVLAVLECGGWTPLWISWILGRLHGAAQHPDIQSGAQPPHSKRAPTRHQSIPTPRAPSLHHRRPRDLARLGVAGVSVERQEGEEVRDLLRLQLLLDVLG